MVRRGPVRGPSHRCNLCNERHRWHDLVLSVQVAHPERRAATVGFTMSSAAEDGRLFTALAAAKPGGAILELGTGTGLGTAFLLAGMNAAGGT